MKYSKQRELVLKAVCDKPIHPTAEYIYNRIKKDLPTISLATVYRNLNLLVDIGTIQRVNMGNGIDRFDGNPTPHQHMLCNECGQVIDIMANVDIQLNDDDARENDYLVESYSTSFFGKCPNCKHSSEKPH